MDKSVDPHHLRALILKIQDYLSDNDRKRLHFFLGPDVPRRIRDDPSLGGTLSLMECLFDRDKINEKDFTFLINAFDEIQCRDAVNILREHMRKMQKNGQHQSVQSVTSMLLNEQEMEDKYATENINLVNINEENTYGDHNIMIDSNKTNINPVTIVVTEKSSNMSEKRLKKSLMIIIKFILLFALLIIIGLSTIIGIFVMKNEKLKITLKTKNRTIIDEQAKNKNCSQINEQLINQMKPYKQMWNKLNIPKIPINAKWNQNGITVAGGNEWGKELNQLYFPSGIYIDNDDETVYVADTGNHRIVEWKKDAIAGQVVAGGNGKGYRNDQLNQPIDIIIDHENDSLIICDSVNKRIVRWPRRNDTYGETIISNVACWGLAMDNNDYLYVSDTKKYEVRRWKIGETNGTLVAGGNGRSDSLDQFDRPTYIFVDQNESVYVSDQNNRRIMKWIKDAKEGIIVADSHDEGNNLTQLSYPYGIIVDQFDTLYIADSSNHRVMRWLKGEKEGTVIVGGNDKGKQANQLHYPEDLSFDRQNNLYVIDRYNHRVQKFFII